MRGWAILISVLSVGLTVPSGAVSFPSGEASVLPLAPDPYARADALPAAGTDSQQLAASRPGGASPPLELAPSPYDVDLPLPLAPDPYAALAPPLARDPYIDARATGSARRVASLSRPAWLEERGAVREGPPLELAPSPYEPEPALELAPDPYR